MVWDHLGWFRPYDGRVLVVRLRPVRHPVPLLAQRLINIRFALNAPKRGTGLNLSLPIFERKVAKDEARLILAIESASRVLDGRSNVFRRATHVRIHLCKSSYPSASPCRIVKLSKALRDCRRLLFEHGTWPKRALPRQAKM